MAPPSSANHDPRLLKAGVLALLVHVGFFIFMIYGLNWKTYPPEGVVVDLWSNLPQPEQPLIKKTEPLLPKKIEPLPPPKIAKPLLPKPELEKLPTPVKPDIALKKEKEKEKEKKLAEEKKAKEQKAKEQKAKEQKAKEQKAKEQKARVAVEVDRLQKEQIEAEERSLQKKAAGAQAAVKKNLTDEYKAKILAKIKSRIIMPPDLPNDPVSEFDITLLPGGEILDVKLRRSSGFPAFDMAVERAIILSRPLPLPPDPMLFPNFRNLSLKVHYLE
ncbi:MAG: protein TolA [Nitrosomonadales bacterium]|nr:MAG: protein TolA [Nitrosomonadales bacterium]